MAQWQAVVTDHGFKDIEQERRILEEAGCDLSEAQCKTAADVVEAARGAHALLVQWAPVTAEVIETLDTCKIIVRYGIGVDNVALEAAKAKASRFATSQIIASTKSPITAWRWRFLSDDN
jgi:D-3-phosphoglycerate dehydrogenase